jgi:hypothetical protein
MSYNVAHYRHKFNIDRAKPTSRAGIALVSLKTRRSPGSNNGQIRNPLVLQRNS